MFLSKIRKILTSFFQIQSCPSGFFESQKELIKNRVRLCCLTVILLFIGLTVIHRFIGARDLTSDEMMVWGLSLAGMLLILFINREAKTSREARFCGCLFAVIFLVILTSIQIISAKTDGSVNLYLLSLFMTSLVIPWRTFEVIIIALSHAISYVLYHLYVDVLGSVKNYGFYHEDAFAGDLISLSIGFMLCLMIRRVEVDRDYQNFVLLKTVEKENIQNQKELELATHVHQTLVPKSVKNRFLDIDICYLPVNFIGGDYAHYRFLNEYTAVFIMADVIGHGVSAALTVNRFHAEFEDRLKKHLSPGAVLKTMDDFVADEFKQTQIYLSAFCCFIHLDEKKLVYSSYGHIPQYILKKESGELSEMGSQSSMLGMSTEKSDQIFQEEIPIAKGDRILLLTDGVSETENRDHEIYGDERLKEFITSHADVATGDFNAQLIKNLRDYKTGRFQDDIFLVDIRVLDTSSQRGVSRLDDWR